MRCGGCGSGDERRTMTARTARIIGSGPAGLIASLALARRGWLVSIAGRRPEVRGRAADRPGRIDVLGGSVLPVLESLGISRSDLRGVATQCPGRWMQWGGQPHMVDHFRSLESAWAVRRPQFDDLLAERAIAAGACLNSVDTCRQLSHDTWTIIANGGREPANRIDCDDRLIALVLTGTVDPANGVVDARLVVEACRDGWAYGVTSGTRACIGFVTDLEALRCSGVEPCAFIIMALSGTVKVGEMLRCLGPDSVMRGHHLACGLRSLFDGERWVRIGDARITFDPLSGRGLWEAIRGAERVAAILDEVPQSLAAEEARTREAYADYLRQRQAFYDEIGDRFGPGFWTRRVANSTGAN